MKRALTIILCALILVTLGGVWFWSLGSIPVEQKSVVRLTVDAPPVDVLGSGSSTWEPATDGMALGASDRIRTGEGARASIHFYGKGETRLSESSEVQIDAASPLASGSFSVRLRLVAGRMWSRVLRLFDLEGAFVVQTNTVVATVRGTAFDLSLNASGTSLWVSDAAVDLVPMMEGSPSFAAREPVAVPEGFRLTLSSGRLGSAEPLQEADVSSDWFMRNRSADNAFFDGVNNQLQQEVGRNTVPFDGAMGALVDWSEGAHRIFSGSQEASLRGRYLERRLVAVKRMVEAGKSGRAFQELTQIQQELPSFKKNPKTAPALPFLERAVTNISATMHDVGPSSPLYRMKLWLEDAETQLVGGDDGRMIFSRLLGADARLDETVMLMDMRRFTEAGTSLAAGESGIENGRRDLEGAVPSLPVDAADTLRAKIRALLARASALRARLDLATTTTLPTEEPQTATSTVSVPTTTTSTTTTPPSTAPTSTLGLPWTSLLLSAQPNPVLVGSSATLHVLGSHADGSTGDLTNVATFVLIGALGKLNGPTYQATQAGSVTIEASVMDHGVKRTSRLALQVNEAVKLSRIDIIPRGQTTVAPGVQVPLTVTAVYSNGVTANVTAQAIWQTSDPNIGSAVNGVFTAWVNGKGSVTITASYAENGVTVQAPIIFTVASTLN